jgi:hypothetical protein
MDPAFRNCPPSKFLYVDMKFLPRNALWELWRQLVSQYTRRTLTFPNEKLPALAGLIEIFKNVEAGEFLHGMWVDVIEQELLWKHHGYSDNKFRPRKAPSWSWVSAADGGIEWGAKLEAPPFEVIGFTKNPYASDGIDEDCGDSLHLRGSLAHISLHQREVTNGM